MAGDDAKTLMGEHERLWGDQANFRTLWQVTAQFVLPAWDNFVGELAEGVNRNYRLFDSRAVSANERFAAAMEWMLCPRSQQWHKLAPMDESLEDHQGVQAYCDQLTKLLFAVRYRPRANFASQADECFMSLGAFGNNALFTDDLLDKGGITYQSTPLNELVWALSAQGFVDTVYRKFKYTAKQAMERWKGANTDHTKELYDKNKYAEREFLHVVRPNNDRQPGRLGPKGMRFESWFIDFEDSAVITQGGYRSFPYSIGRYRVAPREHYGRGPAQVALPAVRTLNEMKKTALRAGQKAVDPPILLSEEGTLGAFNQRPGAANYGAISEDGKPLAQPLETGKNFQVGQELMQLEGESINDAFLITLFQILVQSPEMTATEALIRAQEKGAMIAPAMGRQLSEFLGPLINRELQLLDVTGALPPAPAALLRNGKGIKVEYTSPLARAMRAEEGTAIMNSVNAVGSMAKLDPTVTKILDLAEAAREVCIIYGCPAKLVRSPEEFDEILQEQAQQQKQAQMAQAAPDVSMAALNLAKAQQLSGGAPAPAGATQ